MKKQELHFHRDVISGPDAHVANVFTADCGGRGQTISAGRRVIHTPANGDERRRPRDETTSLLRARATYVRLTGPSLRWLPRLDLTSPRVW